MGRDTVVSRSDLEQIRPKPLINKGNLKDFLSPARVPTREEPVWINFLYVDKPKRKLKAIICNKQ